MFIHTIHRKAHNRNLGDILVRTSHRSQLSFHAGTSPCWHAHCHTCQQVSIDTSVSGPQCSFVIKKAFSCQTSSLVYCTSCRHCTVTNIGETRCTRRQHFGEHLWSIEKNLPGFPIMEHFNTAGHSIHEALKVSRSFWSATQIIRIFFRYLFYYFQVFPSLCFKFRLKVHPLIWRSSFIPFLFIYFILF